jgi:tetrahydromethanopterin S-methyltransferase subunit F
MKKYLIIVMLLLTGYVVVAQNTLPAISKSDKEKSDAIVNKAVQYLFKDASGNDRASFAGFGSAFLNVLGTNGTTDININPTLYTLIHFTKLARNDTNFIDTQYKKQWFARNLQINFGATPDTKNQLQINGGTIGFTFAILNNKVASTKDYQDNLMKSILNFVAKVIIFTNEYKISHPESNAAIEAFQRSPSKQLLTTLPNDYTDKLKEHFPGLKIENILLTNDSLTTTLNDRLAHKPTLVLTSNHNYDFLKSQPNQLDISTEGVFYVSKIFKIDVTGSYTLAVDTTQKNSPLNTRKIIKGSFGGNLKFGKKSKWSWLEFKPSFDVTNTEGPLNKKETEYKVQASVVNRIKVNSNFWLPITIKYDPFHPQLLGLLSVQYSLK